MCTDDRLPAACAHPRMLLRGLDGLPVVGADIVEVAPSYGFADVAVRYRGAPPLGGELLVSCRKPAPSPRNAAADAGAQRELTSGAARRGSAAVSGAGPITELAPA